MTQRPELIADALHQRLLEVYARAESIPLESFGTAQTDVTRILDTITLKKHPQIHDSTGWSNARTDCLSALRLLGGGESFILEPAEKRPDDFLERLKLVSKLPDKRFELLTGRYTWPLNFVLPSELEVREHLLERLMVQLRARIETSSINDINLDDMFLMLNFIALNASNTTDLRYLDALNYYFELLPANCLRHSNQNWLAVSYLSFYASALSSTSELLAQCA